MTGLFRIALYRKSGLLGGVIDWFSGGVGFYHVELVLPDGNCLTSLTSRGLCIVPFNPTTAVVLFGLPAWHAEESLAYAFVSREAGKYDYFGLLKFLCRWVKPSPNRWWCSEAVVAAMRAIGFDVMGQIPPISISPNDMAQFYGIR